MNRKNITMLMIAGKYENLLASDSDSAKKLFSVLNVGESVSTEYKIEWFLNGNKKESFFNGLASAIRAYNTIQ